MDRHLIALDMDGTLLNSENRVTERTQRTLQLLADMGHYIVPATGRTLCLLPEELGAVRGINFAVLENGSLVWDYGQERAVVRRLLPQGKAKEILDEAYGGKFMEALGRMGRGFCYAEIFVDGKAYADIRSIVGLSESSLGENFERYFLENHEFVEHLENQRWLLDRVSKINLYFEEEEFGQRVRENWRKIREVSLTTSVGGNVEFNAAETNKGIGLSGLMEYLNIPKERVIAIGDNENDLEMFARAGTAVAMENAKEMVKKAARKVTLSNDCDGVAVFLETYFGL